MHKGEIQWAGFWLAGLLSVVLAVVKLALALPWSWWRVLLPLGVLLWHNTVYIAVGFIWLAWKGCGREGDDLRIRHATGSTDTNWGVWCAQPSSWTMC